MKLLSLKIGRKLCFDLRALSKHMFAERCGSILATVFPDIRPTMADGDLDHQGVDYCVWAEDSDQIVLAFQCKGFEVQEMDGSQVAQCLHSIRSFEKSVLKSDCYYLIVNRVVKGPIRTIIETSLQNLVQSGKTGKAELLGLEEFLELVFQESQKQLFSLMRDLVANFADEYRQRLEAQIYLREVPFKVDSAEDTQFGPLKSVENRILTILRSDSNKRSWTFVAGEFGFGKTALTFQLAQRIIQEGLICLYLPAARFSDRAWDGEAQLMWSILQLLDEDEINKEDERDKIRHAALKEILKRDKKIVLILDGIDEHPVSWREGGLATILAVFKTFNTSCLFTVREEYLAERSGTFEQAVKGGPGTAVFYLREWTEPLLLAYTAEWKKSHVVDADNQNILHFEETVRDGRYISFYGDVPKRPLFLKMLLEDIAAGDIRSRNLAELYTFYFKKKFLNDRATSVVRPVVRRPLSLSEDSEQACGILLDTMTAAAGKMYHIENSEIFLERQLPEKTLRECADGASGGQLSLMSITVNSLLIPVGRRDATSFGGRIAFVFAHRSFQEYFLARHFLSLVESEKATEPLRASIPKPVLRFLHGLVAMLPDDK